MCECIKAINEMIARDNTQLTPVFMLRNSPTKVRLSTEKIDPKKRKGPIAIFAAYCPFCGLPYEGKPQSTDTEQEKAY
jgi:hypothetical protein